MNYKKVLRLVLGIAFFIILIILSSLVIKPVYDSVTDLISAIELKYSNLLEDKTGLKVTYKSLSPSIFSNINIKGIEISEISSGKKIIEIRKAVLSYKLKKINKENPLEAIDVLTVNGVKIEYDAVSTSETTQKIFDLLKNENKKEETSEEKFDFSNFKLPFQILIKDISIHYLDKLNELFLNLKSFKINGKDSLTNELNFSASGIANFRTEYLKEGKKRAVCATEFDVNGTFFPTLNGSSATIQLSNVSKSDYTISQLNALLNYENSKLQLRTMRTAFPFNLFAEFDFENSKIHADLNTDGFNPFKLLVIKNKNDLLRKLSDSVFYGTASCDFNFDSFDIRYKTNLTVNVSERLFGERFRLYCKSSGNDKKVNFSKISFISKSLDIDYSGTLDIKNLKPFGTLNLNHFILDNQSIFAAEVFLEPSSEGFNCYAPQLFMNAKSLTDVEISVIIKNDSVDFSADFKDYSHYEQVETGKFSVDGSFIFGKNPYIQAHASISDLFLDSISDIVSVFLPTNISEKLLTVNSTLNEYVLSNEMYFSTDFDNFTYNVPYGVIANFNKHGEILTFSADGSNKTLQVNTLDLQYGSQSIQASLALDFNKDFEDISFSTNFTWNSMPYVFYGNVTPEWISISGDYGFDSMISIFDGISGFVQFSNFPIVAGDFIFSLSTMSTFSYSSENGINLTVARFETSEISGAIPISPKIAFSGELFNSTFIFNALSYTDNSSELDLGGSLNWNIKNEILNNAGLELYGQSPISTEKITINASVENSNSLPFSFDALINDYYITLAANIESFPMSRFFENQEIGDILNAEINATGTIKNPFVYIDVSKIAMSISGYPLFSYGTAILSNGEISISDLNIDWAFLNFKNLSANLSLKDFSGSADTVALASVLEEEITIPLEFSIESIVDEENDSLFDIPEFFTVSVKSKGVSSSFFANPMSFKLNVVHIPGQFDICTDNPKGFKASIADNRFTVSTGKNEYLMFDLDGNIIDNEMDIYVKDIFANFRKLGSNFKFPFVSFNSGILDGNIRISGLTTDPEFAGFVDVENFSIDVPFVSPKSIKSNKFVISANSEIIYLQKSLFLCGDSKFFANADITMNRWDIDNILFHLTTIEKKGIPINMELPLIHAKGDAFADLNVSISFPDYMVVQGSVLVNNSDIEIVTSELQNQISLDSLFKLIPKKLKNVTQNLANGKLLNDKEKEQDKFDMNILADLKFMVGNNVRVLFNPFMRALITPNTSLAFYMDSQNEEFAINGDVSLHGGEISWLNRNFYMKEGKISFNENQDNIDPRITIRAETREQDDAGKRVTITLSAMNQLLSQFNPVFSSMPAKSETEIMALLGQVISADSEDIGSLALSGGDYLIQTTVIRRIENTLRELCNFDIFSIRTNVLQNTLKQGMSHSDSSSNVAEDSNSNINTEKNQITFSNFFDNSTVYIGKYFGSAIYVDAMFHWTYDKTRLDDGNSVDGLVFQPEFGFEMASPYANIRFGIAPDINAVQQNQWVSSTSITLSWKYSF